MEQYYVLDIPYHFLFHLSSLIPDKNTQQAPSPASPAGQSAADELKKYKELLDQGIITEDEFQNKKAQLLSLL